MSLRETVEKIAAEYLPDPPQNEADTCHWIIYPLLLECGYAPRDISSQRSDANREFPDYTLLLNKPQHTWFVEAKAWNVALEDRHAQQALNYTNSNGKRWVVLTNGRLWRLYDNSIQGLADNKRVVEANLENTASILKFLSALSKEAVCADQVPEYAMQVRLQAILSMQLLQNDSKLIASIVNSLRDDFGVADAKNVHITQFFQSLIEASDIQTPKSASSARQRSRTIAPSRMKATDSSEGILEYTFEKFIQQLHSLAGRKPSAVRFANAATWQPVTSWAEFVAAVVGWVGQQNKLPSLPFQATQGNRYFLNIKPCHVDVNESMRTYKEVQTPSGCVFVNTNTSTMEKVSWLCALCEVAGVAMADVSVRLS